MTLTNIIKGSFNLNKWKLDDDTIESNLDIVKNISWIYFLLYSFILGIFSNIVAYFVQKKQFAELFSDKTVIDFYGENLIQLINSYTLLNSIIEFLIYFLIGLFLSFLGFQFINLFFKSDITFTQFYKVIIYILIPVTFIIILLLISQLITLVVSGFLFVSIILTFVLLYFGLRYLVAFFRIMSKAFETTQWKLFGVMCLWGIISIILYLLIITPVILKLPMTTQVKIETEIQKKTMEELLSGYNFNLSNKVIETSNYNENKINIHNLNEIPIKRADIKNITFKNHIL